MSDSDDYYRVTFKSTTDVDDERVIQSLIRGLTLPLLMHRIIQASGEKEVFKALLIAKRARKWSDDIAANHGVHLDPVMDIKAAYRGEYLEFIPDEIPTVESRLKETTPEGPTYREEIE